MNFVAKVGMIAFCMAYGVSVQAAGDAEAGKTKSATCQACHGAEGIAPNPMWPNLAGQQDQYLIASMKAYRDGDRKNAMMSPMAAPLSDQDIEDLAAYFSGLGRK